MKNVSNKDKNEILSTEEEIKSFYDHRNAEKLRLYKLILYAVVVFLLIFIFLYIFLYIFETIFASNILSPFLFISAVFRTAGLCLYSTVPVDEFDIFLIIMGFIVLVCF